MNRTTQRRETAVPADHVEELRATASAAGVEFEKLRRDPCATGDELARARRRFSRAHRAWLEAATDAISPEFANRRSRHQFNTGRRMTMTNTSNETPVIKQVRELRHFVDGLKSLEGFGVDDDVTDRATDEIDAHVARLIAVPSLDAKDTALKLLVLAEEYDSIGDHPDARKVIEEARALAA